MSRRTRLLLALAVLAAGCSRGNGPREGASRMDAMTRAHQKVLVLPVCEAIDADTLRSLGLDPANATAEPNPIWSTCIWGAGATTLTLNVSSVPAMSRPIFEEQDVEEVAGLEHPQLDRAGIVDRAADEAAPQPCSSLYFEVDEEGTAEVEICGPSARDRIRTAGAAIVSDVLAAWR